MQPTHPTPTHVVFPQARPNRRLRRRHRRTHSAFTLIEMMMVMVVLGVLLNIAAPSVKIAHYRAQARSCTANLKRIQYAKDAYMLERNRPITTPESEFSDFRLYGPTAYLNIKPVCPNGGSYNIGAGYVDPECNYGGGGLHVIDARE